jgi:hypothetical protein
MKKALMKFDRWEVFSEGDGKWDRIKMNVKDTQFIESYKLKAMGWFHLFTYSNVYLKRT